MTEIGRGMWLMGTALGSVVLIASPAMAQTSKAKTASNQELLQRIERLETELEESKSAAERQRDRVRGIEQKIDEVQWTFKDGRPVIKTGDGRFELAFRGRVHFDTAHFLQDDTLPAAVTVRDLSSGAVVRRAQFGVEGKAFRDFWYEMRFNFGGSDTESSAEAVNIMRVAYHGIDNFRLNVGVMQPQFTHSDSVSSNEVLFIERAAVINTILGPFGGSDGRRAVEATFQKSDSLYHGDNVLITGTFSGQTVGSARGNDEGTQILGRVAYRFWSDGTSNAQIGGSGAKILSLTGGAPGVARTVQFRDRPEIRVDGTRLVDTGAQAAEGGWVYGVEGGANFKNFYVAGEYYKFGIDRDFRAFAPAALPFGNPEFSGWYVEGSWILTGETRSYAASSRSNNAAVFGAPKVKEPFSLTGGGWGALEAAVRYSVLDLNWNEGALGAAAPSGGIRGGEQQVWGFGLNWYLNNNIRLMANYLMVDVDRLNAAGADISQDVDVIAGRVQFAF